MSHASLSMVKVLTMTLYKESYYLTSETSQKFEWPQPTLEFHPSPAPLIQESHLYLIPSTFGEDLEPDEYPIPTPTDQLPEIHQWSSAFLISLIEVWAGKRQPAQLISRCHQVIYCDLLRKAGKFKEMPKIKSIHLQEPLNGLCEMVATIRFGNRLRALAIRIEGVNQRWICTAMELI